MSVSTGRAVVRAMRVVNRGGVDPVDATRMTLRVALFDGQDVSGWRRDAACREVPPDLFFSEAGETGHYRAARSVCGGCPVRADCLNDALSWERPGTRHGVLAGLTPPQRERLARTRRGGAA